MKVQPKVVRLIVLAGGIALRERRSRYRARTVASEMCLMITSNLTVFASHHVEIGMERSRGNRNLWCLWCSAELSFMGIESREGDLDEESRRTGSTLSAVLLLVSTLLFASSRGC